jgi:hypothetical protein
MAKHSVSFRELLALKRDAKKAMNALKPVVEFLGENTPIELRRVYVHTCNRVAELDAIKRDRFKESQIRQELIGCGVEF